MTSVVIVGAGIQGCSMALAAIARGVRPIIIECAEPGGGATGNSYGIVHGGLRYLQSLNLPRWRRSRLAQQWFQRRYPDHVRPLRCVMPLYAGRLRSPPLFAAARIAETMLSSVFRLSAPPGDAGALTATQISRLYDVPREGLIGGAYWHDLELVDAHALIRAMLADIQAAGATVITRHKAEGLIFSDRVRGINIRDCTTGRRRSVRAETVIDCCGAAAGGWTQPIHRLNQPTSATLAFNLLLDIPSPLAGNAIAISPTPGAGRSYFLREVGGLTLAGTFYRPAPGASYPDVAPADVASAMDQLRICLPGQDLASSCISAVTAGLLPDRDGSGQSLATGDRVLMPLGPGYHILLTSKLTTAPLLGEKLAARLWPVPAAAVSVLQHA